MSIYRLSCGGCGNNVFQIRSYDDSRPTFVLITCDKCGSETRLGTHTPRLTLNDWKGDGGLCVLNKEES